MAGDEPGESTHLLEWVEEAMRAGCSKWQPGTKKTAATFWFRVLIVRHGDFAISPACCRLLHLLRLPNRRRADAGSGHCDRSGCPACPGPANRKRRRRRKPCCGAWIRLLLVRLTKRVKSSIARTRIQGEMRSLKVLAALPTENVIRLRQLREFNSGRIADQARWRKPRKWTVVRPLELASSTLPGTHALHGQSVRRGDCSAELVEEP